MDYKHLLFSFQGRISRQSYWTAWAIYLASTIAASIVGTSLLPEAVGGTLILLVWLIITYSSLAVAAKRWHDRDKSGWWSLIALVPAVGVLWMIVENGFLPGTHGPNRFGPDPVKPVPLSHEGKAYFRHRDGSFTDRFGSPVRDAALIGALGTAFLAMRPGSSGWDGSAIDRLSDSEPNHASSGSPDSGSDGGGGGD